MEQSKKESKYKNPLMEKYKVEGQIDMFSFLLKEEKEDKPFELCMNSPVEGE